MKDSVGKGKFNNKQNFPKKVIVDNISFTDEPQTAENFYTFFTKISPKPAKEREKYTIKFYDYLKQCDTIHPDNPDSVSYYSFQISKSSGYYDISFNVV